MTEHNLQMTKEIKRRSVEKRQRRRSLQIRFAIVLIALGVLAAWAKLFLG